MFVKQITPTSWILTSSISGKKVGLALQKTEGFVLISEPGQVFESLEMIAKHFGEHIKDTKPEEDLENAASDIEGYPIKHSIAVEIASDPETNLHSYKIKAGSKVTYVAGYFGVKFKSGYVASFCPKIETLLENDYIGPFKDKFDMQFNLLKHNREGN